MQIQCPKCKQWIEVGSDICPVCHHYLEDDEEDKEVLIKNNTVNSAAKRPMKDLPDDCKPLYLEQEKQDKARALIGMIIGVIIFVLMIVMFI